MNVWEKRLNIKKPKACKRSATCCQTATSVSPWNKIHNAKNDPILKDFFNIFTPYKNQEEIKTKFPEAYQSSIEIARTRKDIRIEDIYFYHCRFLIQPNICPVYEDRPTICRSFPESPFDAIPETCGYYGWSKQCKTAYINLQLELRKLKLTQFAPCRFYIISPVTSWLK